MGATQGDDEVTIKENTYYCSKCGSECVRRYANGFNVLTGGRNVSYECGTGTCGHDGVDHTRGYIPGFLGFRTWGCVNCGAKLDPMAHMQGLYG